jgi:hypothetical protein
LMGSRTTSPFTNGWSFTKADNGIHSWTAKVIDTQGNSATSTPTDITVNILADERNPVGALRREVYRGIPGTAVGNLTASPRFPAAPNLSDLIGSFESADLNEDNYGEKLSGYLIPPMSGSYVFYLASDDTSQLWLSTDENPANKRMIVEETSWNIARDWQGQRNPINTNTFLPSRRSAPITLQAGKWYSVEALHKEADGGDHIAVTWKLPGGNEPANGSVPIAGAYLAYRLIDTSLSLGHAQLVGNTLRTILVAAPNQRYTIERSLDLIHWEKVMDVSTTGETTTIEVPVSSGSQREFFRAGRP